MNTLAARFSKGSVTFGSENNLKSKPVEFITAQFCPSSQTGQFCFVNWYFHCIIFKVIDTLILNANTLSIKQLLRSETFSGLSRNGPLTSNFKLGFYIIIWVRSAKGKQQQQAMYPTVNTCPKNLHFPTQVSLNRFLHKW